MVPLILGNPQILGARQGAGWISQPRDRRAGCVRGAAADFLAVSGLGFRRFRV